MSDRRTEDVPGTRAPLQGVEIVVTGGPDASQSYLHAGDAPITIGTHPTNVIVLRDRAVSRFHCELELDGSRLQIRDLGSRNGSSVDGVEIERGWICATSRIRVGRTELRVSLLGTGAAAAPGPVRMGGLVGRSPSMVAALAQLRRAAAVRTTVLVEGETGTGKEVAARTLHALSERSRGGFEVVDCAALPATLLESELFGHERGAFTGAAAKHEGAFVRADGGTLFLDELGELPLELQPKLLRAIEQRCVRPLGASTTRQVDVRIVAATNRDLRAEVNAGRFRADLYYRVAVIRVVLPPLRARAEDLPELVASLLESLAAPPAVRDAFTSREVLDELGRRAWPGNVRELRNHLERGIAFHDLLGHDSLAHELPADGAEHLAATPLGELPYAQARELAISRFERRYAQDVLRRSEGNVVQAAAAAGVSRSYLHKLLARHRDE